jgi:serine/threonine protein kinase
MSRVDTPATPSDRAVGTAPTPQVPAPRVESGQRRTPSHSSDFGYEARYVPGATLVDRYRIVSPLGKGGMGEVYRAEDLKLGQTVALKFLPKSLAGNEESLSRFTREVRLARQVSHPNVCRVFDIGEADGQTFLTMEFVDGEDIASLMRRIGRLPADKALEIARQVCAGLAAAHEHGIIHRDLKPANIMLDGRGRARITDFGLAGLSTDVRGENARAGTPAYMSPEQFSGGEVTPKSDIYSLGLVMYEIFTGKRPYEAATFEEMGRLREKSTPVAPSEHLKNIDPLVERVMLRCLEKNLAKRPISALQVAAALPGGDPLAAALAAGETPSPEMVAASGEKEGLRPAIGWVCLLLIVLGLAAAAVLSLKTEPMNLVSMPNPPDALAAKAGDILHEFRYTTPPTDTASSFSTRSGYSWYLKQNDPSLSRWSNLSSGVPPSIVFWYRASPEFLSSDKVNSLGSVMPDDPPNFISGECEVFLDPQGHLLEFKAVPPEMETSQQTPAPPSWDGLFVAAGLDASRFKAVAPQWTPLAAIDSRAAWMGVWPGHPELPLRVEAASFGGRFVYFELISPWTVPARMPQRQSSTAEEIQGIVEILIVLMVLLSSIVMAQSNFRSGRCDLRGASRLALLAFLLMSAAFLLLAHHTPSSTEFETIFRAIAMGLCSGATSWLLYVALEPHVRKRWPNSLISWGRLLAGQMRDPVVGRDLLFGSLTGVFWATASRVHILLPGWMGKTPSLPDFFSDHVTLTGFRMMIGGISLDVASYVAFSLFCFFAFFLIRLMVRKHWWAIAVTLLLVSFASVWGDHPVLDAGYELVLWGIGLGVLIRFGLLPLVVALCVNGVLEDFPLTTHLSAWYAEPTVFIFCFALAVAVFGFYTSTAGKQRFGEISLDG